MFCCQGAHKYQQKNGKCAYLPGKFTNIYILRKVEGGSGGLLFRHCFFLFPCYNSRSQQYIELPVYRRATHLGGSSFFGDSQAAPAGRFCHHFGDKKAFLDKRPRHQFLKIWSGMVTDLGSRCRRTVTIFLW